MGFYDKLINVRGNDISSSIKDSLRYVNDHYENLTHEQTCYIYASLVYDKLKSFGVSARLINTNDLGFDYLHYFVLVPYEKDKYYLVDPTYSQFHSDNLKELLDNGYISLNDDIWDEYMNSILKRSDMSVDEAFNYIKKWDFVLIF